MTALGDFDRALQERTVTPSSWSNDEGVLLGAAASKLSEQDLTILKRLWPVRPPLWQQRCAEVLAFNRQDLSIEILLDMVAQADAKVSLVALESLRDFDSRRFTPGQAQHILGALDATLKTPLPLLHRVVLEAFAATMRLDAAEGAK